MITNVIAIVTIATNVNMVEVRHPSNFDPATDRVTQTTVVTATNVVPIPFAGRTVLTTNVVALATNVVTWQWKPVADPFRDPLNIRDQLQPVRPVRKPLRAPRQATQ